MILEVTVFNGSPKGDNSVTLQYVRYIAKKFPQHTFKIIHISQRIRAIEKDEKAFESIMTDVATSDLILWAFPLYVCLVPSQYKRFIELIAERNAGKTFQGKYAAAITTSVHFFDHSAHHYIHGICEDLGMHYAGGFSAEMYDLMKGKERNRLIQFAQDLFSAVADRQPVAQCYSPLRHDAWDFQSGSGVQRVAQGARKIVLITDLKEGQNNLAGMIRRFGDAFAEPIDIVNLRDLNVQGGCLGCCECGYDNTCAYTGKDGFIDFFNDKVKAADALIFAGSIQDRYLSSLWKCFFDRAFFNTHIPTLMGKQAGFIISGPLKQIPNLRQILEAYIELQQGNLVDIVTDECGESPVLEALLQSLAERMVRLLDAGYVKPPTFLGIGGKILFRDAIWGKLRFAFQADHRYYKKHRLYDFPQKDFKTRRLNLWMTLLTRIPPFRREFTKRLKEEMVKPLQRVVENK